VATVRKIGRIYQSITISELAQFSLSRGIGQQTGGKSNLARPTTIDTCAYGQEVNAAVQSPAESRLIAPSLYGLGSENQSGKSANRHAEEKHCPFCWFQPAKPAFARHERHKCRYSLHFRLQRRAILQLKT